MRATALFILLLALNGLAYGQDAVGLNVCPPLVTARNTACVSTTFGIVDLDDTWDSSFCSDGFRLTQCMDGSCLDSESTDAIRMVVPPLLRPYICPICSTIPFILEPSRAVCTMFGLSHLVPFNRSPQLCTPSLGSTILLNTSFITLTALTSPTENFTAITSVRFDYHGCVVFSQTWSGRDAWSSDRVPTAGWFPHTIRMTQNSTTVTIALAALNTDIIINKVGRFLSVSIGYGVRLSAFTDTGACVDPATNVCSDEESLLLPAPTTPPCTTVPTAFSKGCNLDLLVASSSDFGQNAIGAASADTFLRSLTGNGTVFQDLEFQRKGLPIVITLVPTGVFVGMYIGLYFWRKRVIRGCVETMAFAQYNGCCNQPCCNFMNRRYMYSQSAATYHENLTVAPKRAIWCWMVFCLNTHALGLVFSFTGLVLLSMFCGLWIFVWLAKNVDTMHYGNSKFSVASIIVYKVVMALVLPQQVGIGIIGVVAYDYYLYEVQFWWGIAVLIWMGIGAFWMIIVGLDLNIAATYLLKGNIAPKPANTVQIMMEARAPQAVPIVQGIPEPQNHVINVQQQHVIQPAVQVAYPNAVQVSDQVIPQPQAHIIQPQPNMNMQVSDNVIPPPQAHVIQPQPGMYAPPDHNPYIQPAPANMVPGYGSVNIASNVAPDDACGRVAKRTIKMAAIDLEPFREEQICQKIIELLQSMGLAHCLRGEDGEAASLRNDLAKHLAEEVRMYKNDSIEEMGYGLKEAILLWKSENRIT